MILGPGESAAPFCAKSYRRNRGKIGIFSLFLAVLFAPNLRGTDNGIMIFHFGPITLSFCRVSQTVHQRSRARIINSDR